MNVPRRTDVRRFRLAAPSRATTLALTLVAALACALVLGPALAQTKDDHEGHSHDAPAQPAAGTTPAPAGTAPAATAKPAASAKNTKAAPDSLPKIIADAKKDSTNSKKQYRLGVALLDRDQAADAVVAFEKAVKYKPDFLEAWVNLGAARDATGHGPEARDAYRKALELHKDDEIALCRLASSYYATGLRDSAMAVLRHTIEKNPRSHCSYFTLGVSFADAGMFKEAIQSWAKVVEFAPTSPEAESAKESIKLLKEYMGGDSTKVATKPATGVPAGAGGPGSPLPGGEMNTKPADMKSTDTKSSSSVKTADTKAAPKSGGK